MPGNAELLVILEIGPHVAGVMASAFLALAALRIGVRALCDRRVVAFLAAWVLGIGGFASLDIYRSSALGGAPDPLSGAEIWRFLPKAE